MGFSQLSDEYPWDSLGEYVALAESHPDGVIDLAVGAPKDPTPQVVTAALCAAQDAHSYPTTAGSLELRQAAAGWFARQRGVVGLTAANIIATIGSKELVGLLPSLLGLTAADVLVHPAIAYPTYAVGARLAGAQVLATDDVSAWENNPAVKLVWVNSPANPHGQVLSVAELKRVVDAARKIGAVVASDECYAALNWVAEEVPSVLDPRVCGGNSDGLLVAYSLSKQSTMAGYRGGILAGDEQLIAHLLRLRKHLGLMVPQPVQAAMVAAFNDDAHVALQREHYGARREVLSTAVMAHGWQIDHSEAGLYLWVRSSDPADDCWTLLRELAKLGILGGPGEFYGDAGSHHVRIALTATSPDIERAAARLRAASPH